MSEESVQTQCGFCKFDHPVGKLTPWEIGIPPRRPALLCDFCIHTNLVNLDDGRNVELMWLAQSIAYIGNTLRKEMESRTTTIRGKYYWRRKMDEDEYEIGFQTREELETWVKNEWMEKEK
jgi:hypothetical protein